MSAGLLAGLGVAAAVAFFASIGAPVRGEEARPAPSPPEAARGPRAALAARLAPLHRPLPAVRDGDWRAGPGRDERRQTYADWLSARPTRATGQRRVLYVCVVGALDEERARIVDLASEFLGHYFGLPVRRAEAVAVDADWPYHAKRGDQLLTRYVLYHVLKPALPDDAAALIGFTAWDLWPGEGWNYVFGQATLENRVGVWSVHRFGNPAAGAAARARCLRRTLKVATHETGHMFSFEHCLAHACNMGGSNHLAEADRQPLWLCPECLRKLWDATGVDPAARFEALRVFCKRHGLGPEAAFYDRSLAAVEGAAGSGRSRAGAPSAR